MSNNISYAPSSISNNDIYLLISDTYRSITVCKYDINNESIIEQSRDFSPQWITESAHFSYNKELNKHFFLGTDTDSNIIVYRWHIKPKNNDEKYRIEKVAFFNYGERINKFRIHSKVLSSNEKLVKFTSMEGEVKYSSFGTVEGSLGFIIQLAKQDYEFLDELQKTILLFLTNIGGFNYSQFRGFKDSYCNDQTKGFIDGNILNEFLIMNNSLKETIIKSITYNWKRSIKETILMIEMLNSFN